MKLVDIVGLHLEAASGAPLILLREHDAPHRVLPIFIGVPEAAAIYMAVSGQTPPRPFTHDVMAALVESLDARVERVEVTDLHDGTFVAELAVRGPSGGRRLDNRPSDAIALAVRVDAPLYVSDAVLDEAGTLLIGVPGDAAIDEEVARFRSLLDQLDPADFAAGPVPEPPPTETGEPDSDDSTPGHPPDQPDA